MKKSPLFIANTLIFSVAIALYAISTRFDFDTARAGLLKYMSSPKFMLETVLLTLIFSGCFWLFADKLKACPDEKKERSIFSVMCVLLVLETVMLFFKYTSIFNLYIFGFLAASVIWLHYERTEAVSRAAGTGGRYEYLIIILMALLVTVMAAVKSIAFHNNFFTFGGDMGIFTNAAWNTAYDGTQFSLIEKCDHRAVHFQPVIYLLAALFKINCSPALLLILQSLSLFIAAIFVYRLSKKILNNGFLSVILTASFCVSSYVNRIYAFDFHPEAFYMPAILGFFYFAEEGMTVPALISLAFAAATKEEAAVYSALAAGFMFLRKKDRAYLAAAAGAALYAGIVMFIVIPGYRHGHGAFMEQFVEMLKSGNSGLFNAGALAQLLVFFAGFAFLPVFSLPSLVLILIPPAAIHLLFFREGLLLYDLYYSSFIAPSVFAACIYALNELKERKKPEGSLRKTAVFIFICQIMFHFVIMPLSGSVYIFPILALLLFFLPGFMRTGKPAAFVYAAAITAVIVFYAGYFTFSVYKEKMVAESAKKSISSAVAMVPPGALIPVLTNSNILPHLCCRKYAWIIEDGNVWDDLRPVREYGFKELYYLIYFHDFTYHGTDPVKLNSGIIASLIEKGYKSRELYRDNNVLLARFFKP
jgi:uncharacterized membrane protein